MSLTTLVTFVEVFSVDINGNKSTKHLLQNAKREPSEDPNSVKNTILFNGKNYHYLPFIYQGTTINRSGDNIESNLIMGNHPLSMAKAQGEAAEPDMKVAELQSKLQMKREELDLRERLSSMTNDVRKGQTETQAAAKLASAAMKPNQGGR